MKLQALPLAFLVFLSICATLPAFGAGTEAVPAEAATRLLAGIATGDGVFFDLDPAFGTVVRHTDTGRAPGIKTTITTTGGYVLKLTGENASGLLKLKFSLSRRDKREFRTLAYGVRVDTAAIPALKEAEFYCDGGRLCAANRNTPVICAKDSDGNANILLGFVGQIEAAQISDEGPIMKLSRPASWEKITAREIEDGIYLDISKQYWFDALKAYADFVDSYRNFKPNPIPPQAYEPVWCSWYTLGTGVNEKNIWENAKIAKSLGFGTILIDAGWDAPGRDCITYGTTYGDRVAYFGKFPNMAGLVDRIHKELGMAVELWANLWAISKKSRADAQVVDFRSWSGNPPEPKHFLCPQCAESGEFLAKNIAQVFKSYNVDGIWWDFLDSVPITDCKAAHEHDYETAGQGYNANMTKIVNAVREVNPNALIEIRLLSSNINNKLFANVLETTDTPLSPHDNRGMLAYVHTIASGCVPKTDPTMWLRSRDEGTMVPPDELVGQYMATMIMAGVPSVSQDFTKMTESNRQVVKAYLDFYHAHKTDLIEADFRPVGGAKNSPHLVLQGKDATYLYSAKETMPALDLRRNSRAIYVFNACKDAGIGIDVGGLASGKYTWEAKDCHFTPVSKGEIEVTGGRLKWQAPAPVGGSVELMLR